MKAILKWTINDFPAYGMLSGWTTNGQLACLVYMKQQKDFRLKNRGKFSWFDYHWYFLPRNHAFRRNGNSFRKGRTIRGVLLTAYMGNIFMLRWNTTQ